VPGHKMRLIKVRSNHFAATRVTRKEHLSAHITRGKLDVILTRIVALHRHGGSLAHSSGDSLGTL
jgi:hypothetical protein